MEHSFYITASYLIALCVIVLLGLWLWIDSNKQKKLLLALDEAGVKRRSDRKKPK